MRANLLHLGRLKKNKVLSGGVYLLLHEAIRLLIPELYRQRQRPTTIEHHRLLLLLNTEHHLPLLPLNIEHHHPLLLLNLERFLLLPLLNTEPLLLRRSTITTERLHPPHPLYTEHTLPPHPLTMIELRLQLHTLTTTEPRLQLRHLTAELCHRLRLCTITSVLLLPRLPMNCNTTEHPLQIQCGIKDRRLLQHLRLIAMHSQAGPLRLSLIKLLNMDMPIATILQSQLLPTLIMQPLLRLQWP